MTWLWRFFCVFKLNLGRCLIFTLGTYSDSLPRHTFIGRQSWLWVGVEETSLSNSACSATKPSSLCMCRASPSQLFMIKRTSQVSILQVHNP
ncbi:hypothetical protein K402DRAFT_394651 [Aulographum hederae CBS 113979]|uniref:Uncharacterized protein n=1 Tax=Aulographum hederae CBS 113979 TaxID=1176131 RepID=A0A6G1GXI7_9PEZI|nr:hypothetical protein K402DRAFT_394651 [Aulographum hederae CBS 113979]